MGADKQPYIKREPIRAIGAAVVAFVTAAIAVVNVFGIATVTPEQTAAIVALLGALWAMLEVIRSQVWSPASVRRATDQAYDVGFEEASTPK